MPPILPRPFRLKRSIDPNSNMDPDDVLAAKRALGGLGFMDLPDYGLTPYPDRPMIEAVKTFQRRNNLRVDGVMKPDGPTLETLNRTLAERQPTQSRTPGRFSALPRPERRSLLDRPLASTRPEATVPIRASLPSAGAPGKDAPAPGRRPAGPRLAMAHKPGFPQNRGTEGAVMLSPWLGGGGPGARRSIGAGIGTAIGAAIAAQQLKRQQQKMQGIDEVKPPPDPGSTVRPRTDIAPRVPPPPGIEPPGEDGRLPEKTEFPATPPDVPKLQGRPINEVMRNDPLIFEAVKEELRKEFQKPIESHRGTPLTQRWNDRVGGELFDRALDRWAPKPDDDFDHAGGAHDPITGERTKESYLPNIETDGRKGSSNADITKKHIPTGKYLYLNTGRTLKDGRTGIAIERRSMERLRKNAGKNFAGFLPKLLPGMDEEKLADETVEMIVEEVAKIIGPPPKR